MSVEHTVWTGRWWLPQHAENRLPGVLRRDRDDRPRLQVIGDLTPQENDGARAFTSEAVRYPLILGNTDSGPITLIDCYESHKRSLFDSNEVHYAQSIGVNSALTGVLLNTPDDEVFESLHLEIENLAHWLAPNKSGVEIEGDMYETAHLLDQDDPRSLEYDGLRFAAYLNTVSFHPSRTANETVVGARSRGVIRIESPKPRSFKELDKYTKALCDMITVASGEASGQIDLEFNRNVPGSHSIRAIKRLIHEPKPDRKFEGWNRFLFTCDDLDSEVLIKRWLDLWTRLQPAIETLLAQVYSTESYIQEKAFAVAVAAEAIHTKLYDEPARPPKEFDALLATMLSGVVDETDREWIRVRFSNTLSFKARMENLLSKPDPRAVQVLLPNRKSWLGMLHRSRNIIAHGRASKNPSHLEWLIMMRETSMLLFLVIMQELGISGDRQLKAVESEQSLRFMRSQRDANK